MRIGFSENTQQPNTLPFSFSYFLIAFYTFNMPLWWPLFLCLAITIYKSPWYCFSIAVPQFILFFFFCFNGSITFNTYNGVCKKRGSGERIFLFFSFLYFFILEEHIFNWMMSDIIQNFRIYTWSEYKMIWVPYWKNITSVNG